MIIFDFIYYKRSNFQRREFDLFYFKKNLKKLEFVRKTEEIGDNGRLGVANLVCLTLFDFDFL